VYRNTARMIHVMIDSVNCFDKVFRFGFENILYVFLWITVEKRKHTALYQYL
jgi:hypothetical protein